MNKITRAADIIEAGLSYSPVIKTMPLTSTEKSVLFRKRNADLNRSELRGVYATKEEQVVLKNLIRAKLVELRKDS